MREGDTRLESVATPHAQASEPGAQALPGRADDHRHARGAAVRLRHRDDLRCETAEQPSVSARTVERLVAASRQSVQPAMARGCQGLARDVPDDAFRRRTPAIGWPVAAGGGPWASRASASKKARLPTCAS